MDFSANTSNRTPSRSLRGSQNVSQPSPSIQMAKISHLQKKLETMGMSSTDGKATMKSRLENKFQQVNQLLTKIRQNQDQTLTFLTEKINQTREALESEKKLTSTLDARSTKEIEKIMTQSKMQLLVNKKHLSEMNNDAYGSIHSQLEQVRIRFTSGLDQCDTDSRNFVDTYTEQIGEFMNETDVRKENRHASLASCVDGVKQELTEFEQQLQEEDASLRENAKKLSEKQQEVLIALLNELENEKEQRETSEDKLLAQLEDTCQQLFQQNEY
ncbi:hypothetical protein BLNAU_9152 [Blattamonas nauphoetae]|uniref:SAP domain-containing protein n=1 Tax=Blattamonas nauphoetae TaxID=2049346 RepID=A0ABQ9XWF5_9EUKA|nr:hypothetical protein BLNAU_9152 [Blattamonas nauphoetae]